MSASQHSTITILPLRTHQHLDAAVALQGEVWGYNDLEVDARSILTVATRFAGQVLGAFEQAEGGDRLIGFSLAFASLPFGHLHSHRVGVHPKYQNRGIGRQLKLAQRRDALARGIDQIQWTFDPLQQRNAWFNLVRLGGIARTYLPNLYGITSSPLHRGLPTDRLLIEWDLQSDRVQRILSGESPPASTHTREITLPPFARRSDPKEQAKLRAQFNQLFSDGYIASGFRQHGDEGGYILEKP